MKFRIGKNQNRRQERESEAASDFPCVTSDSNHEEGPLSPHRLGTDEGYSKVNMDASQSSPTSICSGISKHGCKVSEPPVKSNTDVSASDVEKYGYEHTDTDVHSQSASNNSAYGGDSSDKYGYESLGDLDRDRNSSPESFTSKRRIGRRSSLKSSDPNDIQRIRRRASIAEFGGEEYHVNIRGHEKPVRRRRSITFNESCSVKTVTSVMDKVDCPSELWFQDEDYRQIKKKIYDVAKRALKGKRSKEKKDCRLCTRGLESLMDVDGPSQMDKRYQLYDAVLDAQDYQEEKQIYGEKGDILVSEASEEYTKSATSEALMRAQVDEQAILKYTAGERVRMRRFSNAAA